MEVVKPKSIKRELALTVRVINNSNTITLILTSLSNISESYKNLNPFAIHLVTQCNNHRRLSDTGEMDKEIIYNFKSTKKLLSSLQQIIPLQLNFIFT